MHLGSTSAAITFALALTAGLAACSRDVTLPPQAAAPQIERVSPAAAYAGERIELVASGLDDAPEGNVVQFPSAIARGESRSGNTLVVRVPDDAGSGVLTVSASGGVSAPRPFTYRGLGQLRTGAISGEVPLLHKPYRILAVGGDTFLHSDLLLGIVRYEDPAFVRDVAVSVDGLPWAGSRGAVAWLESEWNAPASPDVSRLVRLDLAAGVPSEPVEVAFAGVGPIVALAAPAAQPGADRIAVLRTAGAGVTLALHDADTLSPSPELPDAAPLPSVVEVRGCADAGERQLACLVRAAAGAPLALARVTPGTPPVVEAVTLPAGDVIQEDPVDRADPICAGRTSAGARVAAVALDDGRVALARLDGAPAFLRDLDTGSRTPARSLACAGIGARLAVLAPKRADDLVVAVDAETAPAGRILWSASVPRASRAAADGGAGTVQAAGESDNRVLVLEAATGALLARRSFDVLPGRAGALQSAAWITADGGYPAALVFAVGSPPGVVELPLAAAPGTFPVFRSVPDATGVFGPFAPDDPAYRYYFTLRSLGLEESGNAWDFAPGLETQLGQDGPRDAYVGTGGGLVTIDYTDGQPHLSAIDGATFASLGLLPGDGIFAAVTDGAGRATVRAWSEAGAAAGSVADHVWTAPGTIAGAARLDGVLWAFHGDAAGEFVATRLGDTLDVLGSEPMPEAFDRILAVSPNGRTFVTWEYQPWSWETSVVVWAAAGTAYERHATVPLRGVVSGVAFAGSGERLYVLTRSPDGVVVLE